jgi:hypothetical protein
MDAYSIAPPWHAHHLFDVLPKQNLSHSSGLKLSPFIVSVPDRPSSRLLLAVAMPPSPPPHLVVALCRRPSSHAFSCRCRPPSLASYHLGQYRPRGCDPTIVSFPLVVAMQRVSPCCSLPCFSHTTIPILCACRSTSRRALRGPWDVSAPRTLRTRRAHGTLWTCTCDPPCRPSKP